MINKIRILIATINHMSENEITNALASRYFHNIRTTEMNNLVKEMEVCAPHIVITDIATVKQNVIAIIDYINSKSSLTYFIILMSVDESKGIEYSLNYTNTSIVVTPCNARTIANEAERLAFRIIVAQEQEEKAFIEYKAMEKQKDNEVSVSGILHRLGVPTNVSGYKYVRQAIMSHLDSDPNDLTISRKTYSHVATKFNTEPSCVESAIRHMIEAMWFNGNKIEIGKYFGNNKPTNQNFIATITDAVRLGI